MGLFSHIQKLWKPNIVNTVLTWEELPVDMQEHVAAIVRSEISFTDKISALFVDTDTITPQLYATVAYVLSLYAIDEKKIEAFNNSLFQWITQMGYTTVREIQQELQLRLSQLLGFEDECTEQSALVMKVTEGLNKTRTLFTKRVLSLLQNHVQFDTAFWDDFEEICITSDIGVVASQLLIAKLQERITISTQKEEFKELFAAVIEEIFTFPARVSQFPAPEIIMVVGINGAGKTTTIGKLAHQYEASGKKVLLIGADTFRAAAVEQLAQWAERVGAGFFSKEQGCDPAAVAYAGIEKGKEEGYDVIIVDTAGRLHTKTNLMEELKKVSRVIGKQCSGAPHRTVLVLDATIGQNALSQVALFNEACPVSEIILTKIDGTAKGGISIAIAMQYKIPLTYIGVGEKMEDLQVFDAQVFTNALLEGM